MSALDAWFARGWCGSEGLDDCPTCTARRACRAEVEEMRAEIAELRLVVEASVRLFGATHGADPRWISVTEADGTGGALDAWADAVDSVEEMRRVRAERAEGGGP